MSGRTLSISVLVVGIPLWLWTTYASISNEHDKWQRLSDQLGRIEQRLQTVCPGSTP